MFQFQYGSIGRVLLMAPAKLTKKVSIPVWFDWEEIKLIEAHDKAIGVSIPVWFDWEYYIDSYFSRLYQFQFQYGSIGSSTLYLVNAIGIAMFQFQYGSIGKIGNLKKGHVDLNMFQFQYGSIGSSIAPKKFKTQSKKFKFQFQYGSIGRRI